MSTPTKPFIIWIDHGTEGWQPRDFDSLDEVRNFLLAGQGYGSPMIVTKLLKLFLREDES